MSILIGEEKDEKTGIIRAVYDEELILDGLTAYGVMLKWIDTYFRDDYDAKVGEVISRMFFTEGGFTDYQNCWDLWEKCVKEALVRKPEEKKS